jgi:hypothetical protein
LAKVCESVSFAAAIAQKWYQKEFVCFLITTFFSEFPLRKTAFFSEKIEKNFILPQHPIKYE